MQPINNTYLKFIDFFDVSNWSVQYLKWTSFSYNKNFQFVKIWEFLTRNKTQIDIENGKEYRRVTIKMNNWGVFLRDSEKGDNIWTKKQFVLKWGEFIMSKIDARNGAFWLVPENLKWAIVTNDFPSFFVDTARVNIEFLVLILWTKEFLDYAQQWSSGTTWRQRVDMNIFLNTKIPFPSLEEQNRIVEKYHTTLQRAQQAKNKTWELETEIEKYLMEELGIEVSEKEEKKKGLKFINYKNIHEWWIDKINTFNLFSSNKFSIISLADNVDLYFDIKRWKSPEYSEKWNKIILNQKCNRWNEIDLQFWKTVDENWLKWVDNNLLTQTGDILINSTWEGTIWRASLIKEWFEWLLYDSHLLLLRTNPSKIIPDFFVMFFNNWLGQEQVNKIKSAQATKQTELWVWNLLKIFFPLPPLSVQEKIIQHIWELKDEIKRMKRLSEELKESAKVEFESEIFS